MYQNIEIITTVMHSKCGVKAIDSFVYAKELVHAPITIAEFYESCKDYPIFFTKDANGIWSAITMLGYKEKENTFINAQGIWEKNRYIPAFIRRYPFVFATQPNTHELALSFDVTCKEDKSTDMGRRFFDDETKITPFLQGVLNFLTQFQNDAKATAEFIKQLDDWGLLEAKTANIVTTTGETVTLEGFYIVNEEKLNHLSKKKKEELCTKKAIPLITAHLISLSNIQRLGNR
ncbi:MAG: SapC family protein [Sulfurospirillaceae bacterium]|nr:SapC family protein [Sulfurospirillaceae bacterium]